jgi:thiosulfate/3-mercaptopyruvate sulfurtransferase
MSLADSLLTDVPGLSADLAGNHPPVVLDVRWRLGGPPGRESYAAGHIPGAVFIDLDADLAGPPGAGLSQVTPVVVYDDGDSMAAARAWWILRYFGHGRVRVLDGGFRAWTEAGQPVSTEVPSPPLGSFVARPGGMAVLDADGAAVLARSGLLLDARAAERYRGEQEPVDAAAGHIPGAVSAPTSENLTADGTFLDSATLHERFAGLGASRPHCAVGAYCGSGVTASHEVFALALAGIPAALYVGSWSDWITDPSRPQATGAEPG